MNAFTGCLPTIVAIGSLVGCGLTGCSAEQPPPPPQRPNTLSAGMATVSIDGKDAGTDGSVSCEVIGTMTTVRTGNDETGFTAVIASDPDLLAQSVTIRDLAGFTGSYNSGLGDVASVTMTDRTYQLSGTADGFDTDNPSFRTSAKFSIQAAC